MHAAALALSLGWGDPLSLLALDPDDARIASAVIREAATVEAERWSRRLHGLAEHTGAATIRDLSRSMR